MDPERQIRLVIPPFFLVAAVLGGALLGGYNFANLLTFTPEDIKGLLALFAAGAVVIVPVGYLITSLSVALLRIVAFLCRVPTYEVKLSDETLKRVWERAGLDSSPDKKLTLYAAVSFDHELVSKGVHDWIVRRWNYFNVAFHSSMALLLSIAPAKCISKRLAFPLVPAWWASIFALSGFLLVMAYLAWRDTMKMIEFQSRRAEKKENRKKARQLSTSLK